jgi:hypothetical protein
MIIVKFEMNAFSGISNVNWASVFSCVGLLTTLVTTVSEKRDEICETMCSDAIEAGGVVAELLKT